MIIIQVPSSKWPQVVDVTFANYARGFENALMFVVSSLSGVGVVLRRTVVG